MRDEAVSWAAQHGLLVGLDSAESGPAMCASFTHAPMSLLPTPFPREVFELALRVSPSFAALCDAVSRDDEFLRTSLSGVIKTDEFTRRIWDIYERCGAQEGRHRVELGVLRSDYMLDEPSGLPLQVEVNTVSTSFMALSTRVGEMHRHTISRVGLVSHYAPRAHDGSDRDLDDAAGEAFDKVARFMDLGYPGGPVVDRLAIDGDPAAIRFPRAMANDGWDFSFSGLKTAVVNHVRKHPDADVNDVAASFQEAVADVLVGKARRAAQEVGARGLCLAGGVAANSRLREKTLDVCVEDGYRAFLPSRAMCTDNAAMVAAAAWWRLQADGPSPLDIGANPSLRLPVS